MSEPDEAQIRALLELRAEAVRRKDLDALLATVAPGEISYDVVNPLQRQGADAVRSRASEWFASFATPIHYEMGGLRVVTGGDAAFSHCLSHVAGTTTKGAVIDMWFRTTVCYQRLGGRWLVTHQHDSVPFDTTSGQASLGLSP